MSNIRFISLFVLCILLLQGCSDPASKVPNPENTALAYLQALNTLDHDTAYELLSNEDREYISKIDYLEFKFPSNSYYGDMKNQTSTMMELVSSNIEYTVENQVLDNNSATVIVSMSAPDYSQVFQELFAKELLNAFGGEEEDSDANTLLEDISTNQEIPRLISKEIITLRLEENSWRVFEDVRTDFDKSKLDEKINKLLIEAGELESKKNYLKSITAYQEVLSLDSENRTAISGINFIESELEKQEIKQEYIENIEIFEFESKRINTYSDDDVPAVRFALKNNGDRSLDRVEVTVYFYDKNNKPIHEETYLPVLASSYMDNRSPLKPNYIRRQKPNKYYTVVELGKEWSGRSKAVVTDIEFSEEQ